MITTAYLATIGVALAILSVVVPIVIVLEILQWNYERAVDRQARSTIRFIDEMLEQTRIPLMHARYNNMSDDMRKALLEKATRNIYAMQRKIRGENPEVNES